METKGTITRKADEALDGLKEEFRQLHTKGDFEWKIKVLKQAMGRSDRGSILRELYDMLDDCGIEYTKGENIEYYEDLIEGAEIPTNADEIENKMLLKLYSCYKEFPSPETYMQDMVNRYCKEKDGWQDDPLRLRILKQFIKYGNYLADAGFGGRNAIRAYIKNKLNIRRPPSDEKVLGNLDDEVFSVLETANNEQRRTNGKYGLLKMVDDLATGKFRVEGATKKNLYLFAMVYDMTYYSGDKEHGEILDYKTDIEVNLFRNYYSNNMLRFVSDAYRGRLDEYERDPSGQGINYKNFAEIVYVYFISKKYSAQDKIKLSSEMIDRILGEQYGQGHENLANFNGTEDYRHLRNIRVNDLYIEDILKLSEEEFEKVACQIYNADANAGNYRVGPFQLETEQNTAFGQYRDIIDALEKKNLLKDCKYGLFFTDSDMFKKSGEKAINKFCNRNNIEETDKFERFVELLLAINSFMILSADGVKKTNARNITRTSIIVAYYYKFNANCFDNYVYENASFEMIFDDFKYEIDKILEKAYYQPLCGKNIFDVLVTFSSFVYLNH